MTQRASPDTHSLLLVGERPMTLAGFRTVQVTPEAFEPMAVADAHAVLVAVSEPALARDICHRIRRHARPTVYLAPIILLEAEAGSLPKDLARAVDGVCGVAVFATLYYQQFADRLGAMRQRLAQLDNVAQAQDGNLALKILRYLYVRAARLQPVHDIASARGYHYPELDLMLGRPDDNVFDVLGFLEGQRLLTGEFVDRVHYCGQCGSAFLNFREACPDCHSANLQVEDLIHHFRCAHVAPMEDYQRGAGLHCPKCERELKQIGVDYDKPSSVYICNDCRHTTQEPETATLCYQCGTVSTPERLGQRSIKSYGLTALAENAALYGLDNLFRGILEGELDILPLEVFKRFLRVEVERMRRYQVSHSSLVMLHVQDLDRIYLEAGPRAKEIFGEFGRILRAALRPSDVITAFNDSLFLVLAPETAAEGAAGMAARVGERLDELVRGNFTQAARIVSDHLALDGQTDGDALIERLVNRSLA